jgi:S1-C subfamily serine protease
MSRRIPINARRYLAVAGIAVVCGGVAGRLASAAGNDDNDTTAVTATPVVAKSGAAAPAALYRAVAPGVVTVTDSASQPGPTIPFLPPTQQKVQQLGSGFVLDTQGDIVTNDHVIAGASHIRIGFGGDRSYSAKVVGADPSSDLAVLRVSAPSSLLHPLAFDSSSRLQPGDPVYAIGNPFGLDRTMTAGIVSAVGRDIQAPNGVTIPNAVQTDTAINHGSSGGPLLDASGHVVGVTSQIEGGTVDANVGVGFAVPSDTAKSVVQQLIDHGSAAHAWLGVQVQTTARGVAVAKVTAGSPAAQAGLVAGRRDVIVSVDGKRVHTSTELATAIASHKPGDKIALHVLRGGAGRDVTVTLGDVPAGA